MRGDAPGVTGLGAATLAPCNSDEDQTKVPVPAWSTGAFKVPRGALIVQSHHPAHLLRDLARHGIVAARIRATRKLEAHPRRSRGFVHPLHEWLPHPGPVATCQQGKEKWGSVARRRVLRKPRRRRVEACGIHRRRSRGEGSRAEVTFARRRSSPMVVVA